MTNIVDPALYVDGIPHERFARLRKQPGLVWQRHGDGGFWAVTRHSDVREASLRTEEFSSAIGHTNLWDLEADALDARRSIIDSDAPDHTRLRRLISRSFTPKSLRSWEAATRSITRDVLDDFVAAGGGNFVDIVAAPLPIRVILSILGVPLEDGPYLVELSNHLVDGTTERPSLADDAYGNTTPLRLLPFGSPASHALFEYGERLAQQRRNDPGAVGDDVVGRLAEAVDRAELTGPEFRNYFHVLVFAGNETTRTAITHGAMALANNPEQWERLRADRSLIDDAVEELLRWATPVLHMRRTAAVDTELAGTEIAAGDKVVMWYASANFDESIFDDPYSFNLARWADSTDAASRNNQTVHQAFGGGGRHFCLGAYLARMEIRVLLEEMLDRGLTLVPSGEPRRVASNFVNGVLSVDLGFDLGVGAAG